MSDVFIFWDIDDTLNVSGRVSLWSGDWLESTVTREEVPALFVGVPEKFKEFPLRVSKTLLDSITYLSSQSGVTSCWFSAWGAAACTVFSPKFGFSSGQSWPSFDEEKNISRETATWWKTVALREFLTSNPEARVIWVDDLIDSNETLENDNRTLLSDFEERVAMIGVVPRVGVTPDVFNFVARLATEEWASGMFIWE